MARLRATASAARSVLDGREHDGMLGHVGGRDLPQSNHQKQSTKGHQKKSGRLTARLENVLAWPMPFAVEMQTCGGFNTGWNESTRKLTLCYELAADFVELYRSYNDKLMASANPSPKAKPKAKRK
jgi:hypothetical protein